MQNINFNYKTVILKNSANAMNMYMFPQFIPFHKKTMSVYRWVIYIQSQSKAYKFIVNLLYWRRETSKNIFEVKVDLKSMSTAKTKMILSFESKSYKVSNGFLGITKQILLLY